MTDIVGRLRNPRAVMLDVVKGGELLHEAADEIERLRRELDKATLAIEAYKACLEELGYETEMSN